MGRNQDLFLQQKFTEHLLSAKCCFEAIVGNKTIQKIPAHIQFTIGTGPRNEQIDIQVKYKVHHM